MQLDRTYISVSALRGCRKRALIGLATRQCSAKWKFLKDLYLHQLKDNGIPPIWCLQLYDFSVIKENFSFEGTIAWKDTNSSEPLRQNEKMSRPMLRTEFWCTTKIFQLITCTR